MSETVELSENRMIISCLKSIRRKMEQQGGSANRRDITQVTAYRYRKILSVDRIIDEGINRGVFEKIDNKFVLTERSCTIESEFDPYGSKGMFPTLYRIYGENDEPLYIGKTVNGASRLRDHAKKQYWWKQVKYIKLEHFDSDARLSEAEILAIKRERPKYNIQFNSEKVISNSLKYSDFDDGQELRSDEYRFVGKAGTLRTARLWLKPEISYQSVLCDLQMSEETGWTIINKIKRAHPEEWSEDAITISWFVEGIHTRGEAKGSRIFEPAPYSNDFGDDFLSWFDWPRDYKDQLLNWFTLPVYDSRFPEFWKWLGWTPSPLQKNAPLRSITDMKSSMQ